MTTKLADYLRIALYAVLIGLVFVSFQLWDKDHPKPTTTSSSVNTTEANIPTNTIPQLNNTATETAPVTTRAIPTTESTDHLIRVKTDVFEIEINALGGNIVQVKLPKYPEALHSTAPFLLLNNLPDTRYLAESGLLGNEGPDSAKGQALYTAEKTDYTLSEDQNELQVKLHWQNSDGLQINKIFTFKRNNYEVGLTYQIENRSAKPWEGNLYLQLIRKNTPPASTQGFANFTTYFGGAISSPEKLFQKVTFKQMTEKNIDQTITGGWAAMIQHYFVSAWVPESTATSRYFSRSMGDGLYSLGLLGPKLTAQSGQLIETHAKFYAGPAVTNTLATVAPGLQLTIDYGWFWFISIIIFWLMQHIYDIVGNWGWSIVIVTLLIKLAFYHLSAKSYRSMSAMKKLQPRLAALKERYGDDKQRFTQETLALYKKEKVNPMSGCLPILVQIPVFIGLYWVLIESVQLRQAPFILWIHDLSTKDPYYILPVLMGISMFLQQRLNPPPPDPMQAKIMMMMPIIFTVMFLNFPAGLMVYWLVNNVLSFLQQWFIMHRLDKAEKVSKDRK